MKPASSNCIGTGDKKTNELTFYPRGKTNSVVRRTETRREKKLLVNKFLLTKYITSKPKYFEKISICNRILCLEFFKWQKVTENSVHSVDVMYQGQRPGFKT